MLTLLLVLTATFGRVFSKVDVGVDWLHPTEILLAAIMVAAVLGRGARSSWRAISTMGVLVPLAVLWGAGAVAAIRGLNDWGLSLVLHDIGLVEYSLLIPIIGMVVRDRSDFRILCDSVAIGGALAIGAYAVFRWSPESVSEPLGLIAVASGMYIALFCIWVAARAAAGAPVTLWHYALIIVGVALIILGRARAAWLALVLGIMLALVLGRPGRRIRATAALAGIFALGVGVSLVFEEIPPVAESEVGRAATTTEQAGGSDDPADPADPGTPPVVVDEIEQSFTEGSGGQSSNSNWRLKFWEYLVAETAGAPLTGVGFGRPSRFRYAGLVYDSRDGTDGDPNDVTGPHNSFVNLVYRAGLPALLALLALGLLAVTRLVRLALREDDEHRALSVWLLAGLLVTATVASLSVALEGPYMGIFFWTILGLALLAPQVLAPPGCRRSGGRG